MSRDYDWPSYQSMPIHQEAQQEAARLRLGAVSQSFLQPVGRTRHIAGVVWSTLLLLLFAPLSLFLGILPIILSFVYPFSLDVSRMLGGLFALSISGGVTWLAFSSLRKEIAAVKYWDREQLHLYQEGFVYLEPNERGKRALRWDQILWMGCSGKRLEQLAITPKDDPGFVLENSLQECEKIPEQMEQAFLDWKLCRAQEQWEREKMLIFFLDISADPFRFLGLDKEGIVQGEFCVSDLVRMGIDNETAALLEDEEAFSEYQDRPAWPKELMRTLAKEYLPWNRVVVREASDDEVIIATLASDGNNEGGNTWLVVHEDDIVADFGLFKALIVHQVSDLEPPI
jgi:hypothetical protein